MLPEPLKTRFSLVKHLDGGGQGRTAIVRYLNDDKTDLVIKILKDQHSRERRTRMFREVAALQTVSASGIARYIESNAECYQDKHVELYLVTEYVAGETFRHLKTIDISVSQAAQSVIRIAETVKSCHEQGILHRDLKPDNLIARGGDVGDPVLIDFGLSFNLLEESPIATFEGQHIGNRFLILPEYRNTGSNQRSALSDIAHIVAILYFLLTGLSPESLLDENELPPHRRKYAAATFGQLPSHQQNILNRVFELGFSVSMDARWQTCDALIAELKKLLNSGVAVKPTFSERLNATNKIADASSTVLLQRLRTKLINGFSKQVQPKFSELQKATKGEFYASFQSFTVDLPAGVYRAIGKSGHSQFPGSGETVTLAVSSIREDIRLSLLSATHEVAGASLRIFDPQIENLMTDWLEDAIANFYDYRLRALISTSK